MCLGGARHAVWRREFRDLDSFRHLGSSGAAPRGIAKLLSIDARKHSTNRVAIDQTGKLLVILVVPLPPSRNYRDKYARAGGDGYKIVLSSGCSPIYLRENIRRNKRIAR